VPIMDITGLDLGQAPLKLVDEKLINQHHALPLFKRGNRLFVGIADPTNTRALDEIKFQANMTVEPILVDEAQLARGIELAFTQVDNLNEDADDEGLENLELGSTDDDMTEAAGGGDAKGDDTPVGQFVNKVLRVASIRGASDIHFEPDENE
jgi:type IV pilus assembly protein PilB